MCVMFLRRGMGMTSCLPSQEHHLQRLQPHCKISKASQRKCNIWSDMLCCVFSTLAQKRYCNGERLRVTNAQRKIVRWQQPATRTEDGWMDGLLHHDVHDGQGQWNAIAHFWLLQHAEFLRYREAAASWAALDYRPTLPRSVGSQLFTLSPYSAQTCCIFEDCAFRCTKCFIFWEFEPSNAQTCIVFQDWDCRCTKTLYFRLQMHNNAIFSRIRSPQVHNSVLLSEIFIQPSDAQTCCIFHHFEPFPIEIQSPYPCARQFSSRVTLLIVRTSETTPPWITSPRN